MKFTFGIPAGLFAAAIILSSCGGTTEETPAAQQEEIFTQPTIAMTNTAIDHEKSSIKWKGEMLGVYAHEGTINLMTGYIYEEDGKLAGGSFVVDMKSIRPTDENYKPGEGKTKDKLVAHLSSPDFFNVDSFPMAMFDVLEFDGSTVKGKLKIRDKEGMETVENVKVTEENGIKKLSGTMTFDRRKYGVSFDSPAKDMVLSDDITLDIYVETYVPKEQ